MAYFLIEDWMTSEEGMNLNCNQAAIYAIIYGFTMHGDGCFSSLDYMRKLTNIKSKTTICKITDYLFEQGYIGKFKKNDGLKNEVKYWAVMSEAKEAERQTVGLEAITENEMPVTDIDKAITENDTTDSKNCNDISKQKYKYINKVIRGSKLLVGCPDEIMTLIERWFSYRAEIKKSIKSKEQAEKFVSEVMINNGKYGFAKVEEVIGYSIYHGYPNVYWDRLEKKEDKPKEEKSSYDAQSFNEYGLNLG